MPASGAGEKADSKVQFVRKNERERERERERGERAGWVRWESQKLGKSRKTIVESQGVDQAPLPGEGEGLEWERENHWQYHALLR